jgi:arylsulfatase A
VRVPCLMRWPGQIEPGSRSSVPGITMDLTATFLAAAGAPLPTEEPLDGVDLLPLIQGRAEPVDRPFYWRMQRSNRSMKAIRYGKWKYVDDGKTMDLLFDLSNDMGERHNLNYTHPEVVEDLKARLAAWEAEMDAHEKILMIR